MFGVAEAASLTAMAIRLHRAKGDEREQIKWFLYAGIIVITGITVEVVLGVPIAIASWLGGMVVPFAIAVALFKYRLYDIDRLINRTLVYGLLTALLAGIYAGAMRSTWILYRPSCWSSPTRPCNQRRCPYSSGRRHSLRRVLNDTVHAMQFRPAPESR